MELKKHYTNEQTGISYTLHGDFYLPDLKAAEENITLGKWGMIYKDYLFKNKKVLFSTLLAEGKLYQHCAEVEKQANEMYDLLIEQMKEAFNYALLDNVIGATYLLNNGRQVVNLTKLFNDTFGTSYTSQQLRTTYFTEFLEFFVAEVRKVSDLLTHRTAVFHQPVTTTFNGVSQSILRHTPKDKQRLLLYNPMFIDAQARVFPEIFNDRYLKMENYEGVDFWQDFNQPESVYVTPSFPDYVTTPDETTAEIPYVVGLLYDVDAIMTQFILDRVATSPLEAAKLYRNTIWHIRKNFIYDATENIVLFIMEDEQADQS